VGLDPSPLPRQGTPVAELDPVRPRPPRWDTGRPAGSPATAQRWAPLLPAALTLAVMLWQIQVPSFWRDEAATLSATGRSFPDMVRLLGHQDAVHGAYYALMWVVIRLGGPGELAVRLPSALAMAAAAGMVAVLGRRLVSARAGLAAGLVFAVLPPVSWFGQDARPFAMETALACVASYLFVRVLQAGPPGRRRWLAGYTAGLVLLGLANLFGLLLIAAHAVTFAAWRRHGGRPRLRDWLIAVTGAVLVMLPFGLLDWTERRQIAWLQLAGPPAPVTLERLLGSIPLAPAIMLILLCAIAVSALGGRARFRAQWPAGLAALCLPWLILPPAILMAVSQLQPVYTFRYIVFCIPAAALLTGTALAALSRTAAAAALLLIVLVGLPAQLPERGPTGHGDGLRQLDQILLARQRPGDVLVYPGNGGLRTFAAAYTYGLARVRDISLGQTPAQAGTIGGTNAPLPLIRHRLAGASRVWVPEILRSEPAGLVPALRGLPFRLVRAWDVGDNVWLILYASRLPGQPLTGNRARAPEHGRATGPPAPGRPPPAR
jgi:mannosyltransferase